MKWRPIGELSDEQRDGKSWLFARKDDLLFDLFGVSGEPMRWSKEDGDWLNSAGCSYTKGIHENFSHFLFEPLPDLPKPLKMEWRRFEDEAPQNGQICLIFLVNRYVTSVYANGNFLELPCYDGAFFLEGKGNINYWMPIAPPEGE